MAITVLAKITNLLRHRTYSMTTTLNQTTNEADGLCKVSTLQSDELSGAVRTGHSPVTIT